MMDVVVNVIAVLAMLWCAVRLLKTGLGVRALNLSRRKDTVLRNMRGRSGVPSSEHGVSVIVAGMPTQKKAWSGSWVWISTITRWWSWPICWQRNIRRRRFTATP
ncbi:MAG: hypothetical protein L6V35_04655 [Alistipes putredinis]|nr:MAG: hypothetical protein L6V35_04655 [Alistipes putredinis]